MKNNYKSNPVSSMKAWDPTSRMGHIPQWFTKLLRARHRKSGLGRRGVSFSVSHALPYLEAWDHIGSVQRDGFRAVFTQPYGEQTKRLQEFADSLGCVLAKVYEDGPWHEGTWYYEFHPKAA